MKTRMFLLAVMSVMTMVSCTKYYRVEQDGTPVHGELNDKSKVLFSLKEGEVVYSYFEIRNWASIYRTDSSGQKGWTRLNKLVRIEGEMEDSLGNLAAEARAARRQAEIDAEQRHKDSVIAARPRLYYRVAADSLDIYTRDMSTKKGQEEGKKTGSLEQGRIVGHITTKEETGKEKWIFVHTADGKGSTSGYVDMTSLERVSQAENDSLNSIAYDRSRGYVFKALHPTLMWINLIMGVLALMPLVWMWRQQKEHRLSYGTLCISYIGAMIVLLGGAASMDRERGFGWCYDLMPAAWSTLLVFPLLYTDIKRKGMRRIANIIYWLMAPLCFMLYAHHQDGNFWPPFKMYLLNVAVYFFFVSLETAFKCPVCGKYGGHADAGTVYEGRFTRKETVREHHSASVVRTEEHYDSSLGGYVKTNYISPEYWTTKIKTTTVDIFTHYKRCYNCGLKFKYSSEEKIV